MDKGLLYKHRIIAWITVSVTWFWLLGYKAKLPEPSGPASLRIFSKNFYIKCFMDYSSFFFHETPPEIYPRIPLENLPSISSIDSIKNHWAFFRKIFSFRNSSGNFFRCNKSPKTFLQESLKEFQRETLLAFLKKSL